MKSRLRSTQMDLVGFAGGVVKPLGKIELEVVFGDDGLFRTVMINFIVVRVPSPYNVIFGRTGVRALRAVSLTIHSMMKFPTPRGIVTLVTRSVVIVECQRLEKKQMVENGTSQKTLQEEEGPERVDLTDKLIKEVEEWVNAGIIRPVRYPTWIANPVLVKKADGSWRMCIDFKNLNSACPKDYYPLPDIDGKIESVVGFRYKCFLDAYKGYHQVQMAQEDEEKTAFYTDRDTYCYTNMPFGLKNAGATYQRLVDTAFQSQIGRNLEAYVDDMVIKSNDEKMLIADIAETFDNLRKINMKLNPKKCSFGVEEGKFLGYMVTSEGIRANPKKTKAIADMQSPRTLKEMQSLSGKLAALKRFLSRSAEKSLPFFETLKDITKENKDEYRWTESTEKAFQEMKQCIVGLPLLTTPGKEETLYVYLAAATEAVSVVLLTERKGKYFEAHPIKVITDQPLKQILNKAQASGKLGKYSVELGAYNIAYETRSAIKRQTLFTDGASNNKGSEAGLVLISPNGVEFTYALRLNFTSTNNEAEYEALLAGLRMAKKMNVRDIDVKVDLKLVASQINGSYVASNTSMIKYLATAKECIAGFRSFVIQNIPRNLNQKADIFSKLATHAFDHLTKKVMVEVLAERSTDRKEISAVVEEEEDNWMTPIIRCLPEGVWPEDKEERRALRMKINQYVLEEGVLFKKGYMVPMLRCVGPLQANYVIREIHMGSYGMHIGVRSVVAKAIRQGYYWPTMHMDARSVTQKCESCQVHAPVLRRPKTLMTSIMAQWPFYQWGMDILGPLPQASGKLKFVIVAIDYFTKWIEAKPLARIIRKDFVNDPFKGWLGSMNIKQMNTAVAHPQVNGLVERANKSLMKGIKERLGRERAGWVNELSNVLWAHRTSLKQSNGETPFSLTYGSEAVIPAKIGMPTHRTMMIKEDKNEDELRLNMDLLQ
ncbi:reverse transcriptase domain-containing protein [Tanacetum coccineum]